MNKYRIFCGTEGMGVETVRELFEKDVYCDMSECVPSLQYSDHLPTILYPIALMNDGIFLDNLPGLIEQIDEVGLEVTYNDVDQYYEGAMYYQHRGVYNGQNCIITVFVYSMDYQQELIGA